MGYSRWLADKVNVVMMSAVSNSVISSKLDPEGKMFALSLDGSNYTNLIAVTESAVSGNDGQNNQNSVSSADEGLTEMTDTADGDELIIKTSEDVTPVIEIDNSIAEVCEEAPVNLSENIQESVGNVIEMSLTVTSYTAADAETVAA